MRRAEEHELLTPDEVMEIFQISRTTLYNWTKSGQLKKYKAGKRLVRYRRGEVMEMLEHEHPVITPEKTKRGTHFGAMAYLGGGSADIIREHHEEAERDYQNHNRESVK